MSPLLTLASPPPLAVFDSRLEELTLPILPIAISDPIAEEEESRPERRLDKVILALEKYFDLIGRVEVGEPVCVNVAVKRHQSQPTYSASAI